VRLLERVLMGEPQKVLAFELGVSPSTIALTLRRCLRMLGMDCGVQRVPLLLIMAAHARLGSVRFEDTRLTELRRGGWLYWVVSALRPDVRLGEFLGEEESRVARMLLEGKSYREIAALRNRSPHTISNQLASAYSKLGVSGRVELLGRLTRAERELSGAVAP
jgi:DNA-binding NarL/FixJ family response regulator